MPPLRTLRSLLLAVAAASSACSSNIDLKPPEEDRRRLNPEVEGEVSAPDTNAPTGQAGNTTRGEGMPNPMLVMPSNPGLGGSAGAPGSMGGGAGNAAAGANAGNGSGAGTGGASGGGAGGAGNVPPGNVGSSAAGTSAAGSDGGAPPCPDDDQDGRCNDVDRCRNDKDDGTDSDADGMPDACDPCGIGVALRLAPLFYFPLDEAGTSATALNLGSVRQNGTYVGPMERGLAGVADPAGRAPRFEGEVGGQFSHVVLLNVPAFPSTALTAMFWVRTSQTGDYVVISYAIEGSANEFAVIVERDRLIVTLQSSTFQDLNIDRNRITDGAWHFVALTWNQTRAQFYFDGEAVNEPLITEAGSEIDEEGISVPVSGPLALSPGGALVLGQDQDSLYGGFSPQQALIGGLDEVAIYDRVLSPEQIRAIFTGTTCGERCDGIDNDGDGKTDEGFLGSSPACPAASCAAIAASSNFGSGDYFSSVTPSAPLTCAF